MKHSLLVVSLFCASASVAQSAAPPNKAAAAVPLPGDDLDGYVNGAWRATTTIPADRSLTGVGLDIFKIAEAPRPTPPLP